MRMRARDYSLFGLKLRSDLDLPELAATEWVGAPDVLISVAPIDARTNEAGLSVTNDGLVLSIDGVGRYLVRGGCAIVVEPAPDVDPRNVRLFLLGSAFGILLHQRGLLPLHANAIEMDGRAVSFIGASGSGKSTLAAWFHDRGHTILADDVCVVDFDDDGNAVAHSGIPRLRLWIDALHRSGRSADALNRSYVDASGNLDKFDLPIDPGVPGRSSPLAAIYLLDRGVTFSIEPLAGVEATSAIIENTYRGGWIAAAGSAFDHWSAAVRLARAIPVFRVVRPWDTKTLDAEAAEMRDHARAQLRL
jgi:hypothetical protein